jgi:hypothetical protein
MWWVVVVVVVPVGAGAAVLTVVWRVVVVVAVGSLLEHDTSINPTTESAKPSLSAFFIIRIVCFQRPVRRKLLRQMY